MGLVMGLVMGLGVVVMSFHRQVKLALTGRFRSVDDDSSKPRLAIKTLNWIKSTLISLQLVTFM